MVVKQTPTFKIIEDERKVILIKDARIEEECEAIHKEFEKLSLNRDSVANLNNKVENKSCNLKVNFEF